MTKLVAKVLKSWPKSWLYWLEESRRNYMDETSKRVGWSSTRILLSSETQRKIYTFGVADCYVLVGHNEDNDIFLGHYYKSLSWEKSIVGAYHEIERTSKGKAIDQGFKFQFIYGPWNPKGKNDTQYYNIFYDPEWGLNIIRRHFPLLLKD